MTFTISRATPTAKASAAGGAYSGAAFVASVTLAWVGGNSSAGLEGVAPTLTYYIGSQAAGTCSSIAPTAAGTYTVVASFAGSADYAWPRAPP